MWKSRVSFVSFLLFCFSWSLFSEGSSTRQYEKGLQTSYQNISYSRAKSLVDEWCKAEIISDSEKTAAYTRLVFLKNSAHPSCLKKSFQCSSVLSGVCATAGPFLLVFIDSERPESQQVFSSFGATLYGSFFLGLGSFISYFVCLKADEFLCPALNIRLDRTDDNHSPVKIAFLEREAVCFRGQQ